MAELDRLLLNSEKPLIMGILNVTPDSFYDGGKYFETSSAIDRAFEMAENGADIIDIGGESSRPGSEPVTESEEIDRVLPIIEAVSNKISSHISIDTYKANVAKIALYSGASIVNDISALRFDELMVSVIKDSDAHVILMHMLGDPQTMQNNPQYDDVVGEILGFLNDRIDFAVEFGIPKRHIIIDPGIGFGKTTEHNLSILRYIGRFNDLDCPVLVGASHKSMIGKITGASIDERTWGSAAIVAHCVMQGVLIHRVHDVRKMKQVCEISFAIKG
ncbi:dihydropteroate synthase [Candidatus Latescibacterota bacterium]